MATQINPLMAVTKKDSNLQHQRSCKECNKILNEKASIKTWLIDRYVFFCSNECTKNRNVEFLDCKVCSRSVKFNFKFICCDNCNHWTHFKCNNLTDKEFSAIEHSDAPWYCVCCYKEVFPFYSLNARQVCSMFNDKSIQHSLLNTKIKCKKIQCYACVNPIL